MHRIDLNGTWKGIRLANQQEFTATVPGCVHTDLMKEGIIEKNIYWRDNAGKVQWIENEDWMYVKKFQVDILESDAMLVFECLDTYSDIYLNGKHVASTDNMFIEHKFNIDGKLQIGENELTVIFHSPIARTKGCLNRDCAFSSKERLYTRRMQCTYGWDWTMRFVTCGIEKNCYIQFENIPEVKDLYVYTSALDSFGAQIVCDLEFRNYENGFLYEIVISDANGKEVYKNQRYCEEPEQRETICIDNPCLWYPVDYGEQPLYTVKISMKNRILERKFGIRTARILQKEDAIDSESYNLCLWLQQTESGNRYDHNTKFTSFTLIINGKKVFCRGANWVPCEPFVSEITKEKQTQILELAAGIGVNMIRIWGGGMFETEHFYRECDRLGIMVTQDFLMACGHYPEDEEWFLESLKKEAEYAARLIRNHPCLVWWSGDNENAVEGNDRMEYYRGRTAALKAIGPVLKKLDPMRPFLLSSPYGGDYYASKTAGTTHNTQFLEVIFPYILRGDLYKYKETYKDYVSRFCAEEPALGAISPISLRKFMTLEDIFESEDMWLYHTKTNPYLEKEVYEYLKIYAEGVLGKFTEAQDRIFKLQYIQYEWMRVSLELAYRNMWFCSGIIFWMLNDCWPAASGWALIDYYTFPKASYYCFKRCAKGLVGSIDEENGVHTLYLCNHTLAECDIDVTTIVLNYKTGEVMSKMVCYVRVEEQSIAKVPLEIELSQNEVVISDIKCGEKRDRAFYKSGKLEMEVCDKVHVVNRTSDSITLRADEYTHAIGLEGEYIFSDNYFSMLEGEEITIDITPIHDADSIEIKISGYTLL